jgi:hypothetical protein
LPERKSLKDAIQNGMGTLVSRTFVIIGVPVIISMGSWIGYRMVDTLDKLVERVNAQHEDTVEKLNRLDVRVTVIESKVNKP